MKWVEIGLLGFLTACTPTEPPAKRLPASEQDQPPVQPQEPAPPREPAVAQSVQIPHDVEFAASLGSPSHGGGYLLKRPSLRITNPGQDPRVVSIESVVLRSTSPSTRQVGRLSRVIANGEDVRFPLELAAGESVKLRLRIEDVIGAYRRRFWYEFEVLVDGEVRRVTSEPAYYRAPRTSRR